MEDRKARRVNRGGQETALQVLGTTIALLRRRRRLSQTALAQQTGLHRTYISEIEHGYGNITATNLLRLAAALQVPPSHLWHALDARPELYRPLVEEDA